MTFVCLGSDIVNTVLESLNNYIFVVFQTVDSFGGHSGSSNFQEYRPITALRTNYMRGLGIESDRLDGKATVFIRQGSFLVIECASKSRCRPCCREI